MTYVDKPAVFRPAFLNGKPKRLFIDGRWVEARSGRTFTLFNRPSRSTTSTR